MASFVVAREAAKGYVVKSADGPLAANWKDRALALLDDLGQPDPKGPEQFCRWVGPVPPSGEYVGTVVTVEPNGEARYHQWWFRLPERRTLPRLLPSGLFLLILLVGLITAFYVGRTTIPVSPPAPGIPLPGDTSKAEQATHPQPDPRHMKLDSQIDATRGVRKRLIEYLSQEGFAAPSAEVVDVKRSIKLIADLDTSPPPTESIRLNNTEVTRLLDLLKILEILEKSHPVLFMPSEHPENADPRPARP